MNGRRYRKKRTGSGGFIPPAMMVLMVFVAVFAILLMVVALVRGAQDRRAHRENGQTAVVETVEPAET